MISVIQELYELEVYIRPEMNVYKNLLLTGLDQLLFKKDFLKNIHILEELLYMVMNGGNQSISLTDEQTNSIVKFIQIS